MGDSVPLPVIQGLLAGWFDTDIPAGLFAESVTIDTVQPLIQDPSTDADLKFALHDAAAGGGQDISATILAGQQSPGVITSAITVSAATQIWLRISEDSGTDDDALGLSGYYGLTGAAASLTFSDLARVKLDANISGTDADRDTVLSSMIAGVSKRMQDWMNRPIVQTTTASEKVDIVGEIKIQTKHYPIISVSALTENGTALVEDTDFEMTPEDLERGQISRISGGFPASWISGPRVVAVSYVHGFAEVPYSLVVAATDLVVNKYFETVQSGKGWRGLASKNVDPGSSGAYDKDIWTRETVPTMEPYRRMVA